ncbi:MAG TPA: pyruvate ferredoxin oxidoreductase [Candidatus Methylomirabilis sp.]|nr:pyruvate ferredoxin oxidoreductase [Candidatus Methylomirabilis sp.]
MTGLSKVISGNDAVAIAVGLAQPAVIAAYPITPQTSIAERLADACGSGEIPARFIMVESEHSAMATCIGAAAAGSRTFTATSSQGLALMHELLHWASGARLPIVMANVNRALAAPWVLWPDQNDSLAQRDTGWIQLYCESNQEVLDTVLQAYRIAETVLVPVMVCLEGFYLSHTYEAVSVPTAEEVAQFLPAYRPKIKLDPADPHTFYGGTGMDVYMEFRYKLQQAMELAKLVIPEVGEDFGRLFGRPAELLERYQSDEAETLVVAAGTVCSTARLVVDERRAGGEAVGLVKLRAFRPFPSEEIRDAVKAARRVLVIDRNISFGHGGILAQEVRSALYPLERRPELFGFVAGLGGRDITRDVIAGLLDQVRDARSEAEIYWVGVRR